MFNKDPEFFNAVVRPFVSNKKEKQLIDYYLLDDKTSIDRYCNISQLERLNKLELALLAQMAISVCPFFATSIINFLKAKMSITDINVEAKNKILDSLFSSKGKKLEDENPPEPKP